MRVIALIGINYLRENRWAAVLVLLWVVIIGAAGALTGDTGEDALFFLKQQAAYGVVFTAFLAASAINNQRRSRRIVAVLSKAVSRGQYLGGIVFGYACVAAVYCIGVGATGAWTISRLGGNAIAAIQLAVVLFAASMLGGTVALFFSTFMSPLFAVIASGVLLGASGAAVHATALSNLLPAAALVRSILEYSLDRTWSPHWGLVMLALAEAAIFWAMAYGVFVRRDLAVAVE